jgi:hypothetical protein
LFLWLLNKSNIKICKSLLLDHAKGEHNKEIRLLLQALEMDCHTAIKNSNDINFTRISLIQQLQSEYFISEEAASSLIDLLLLVLKGYKANTTGNKKKDVIKKSVEPINNTPSQDITHDYEKEAKAERFYQTALKCLFKDINNNFTLAIDSVIKATKLCPNDKRFHFYAAYCFYKVNDNKSLENEIRIFQELGYDNNICYLIENDIISSKQGQIAKRLDNAYKLGGTHQLSAAQSSIYKQSRLSYSQTKEILDLFDNHKI